MAEIYWESKYGGYRVGRVGTYGPSASSVKRIVAAFPDPDVRRREFPWLTDEIAAAVAAFDWPARQEPKPRIEDLTVDCACGEEAGIASEQTDWAVFDWPGGVPYHCAICGRSYVVRVTIEAAE